MRASQEFIKQLEELYQTYEQEVNRKMKEGILPFLHQTILMYIVSINSLSSIRTKAIFSTGLSR
ncbi:hypothetical protein [Neobacillus sp. FSL H8-0543]|uniref:hypothetical protein n=1 Tax=Neobacillus sp. FSL H8-0543 TaxID=2954672 RepID=UPI0031595B94